VALGLVGGGVAYAATRDGGADEVATTPSSDGSGGPGEGATVRDPGGRGTITAVDGTTLTVETDDGATTTVTTDDDTVVTDTAAGDRADIEVGDDVMVMGEEGDDGAVVADRIVDTGGVVRGPVAGPDGAEGMTPPEGMERPDGATAPPEDGAVLRGGPGGGTSGEVTGVEGDTLTVTTPDGDEVTVTTTGDTAVTVTTEIEISDLEVGDVVVFGGPADGDTVAAFSIRRGDLVVGGPGGPGGMAGPPEGARPEADAGTTPTTEA
jgi:hypothetical protein